MVACRRDNFVAKEPGYVSADSATNVYSLNRRAVIVNWPHFSPGERFAQLTITEMASLKYLDKSHFIAGTGNLDNSS